MRVVSDYNGTSDSHNPTTSQSHRPIIPLPSMLNGNRTGKLRVWVYPRVGIWPTRQMYDRPIATCRIVEVTRPNIIRGRNLRHGTCSAWLQVSTIDYGYGSGSWNG